MEEIKPWMQEMIDSFKDNLDFNAEGAIIGFTEDICAALEEQGLTRKELANRMGVKPAYITRLLRGHVNPTLKTMVSVALALNKDFKIIMQPKHCLTTHITWSKDKTVYSV